MASHAAFWKETSMYCGYTNTVIFVIRVPLSGMKNWRKWTDIGVLVNGENMTFQADNVVRMVDNTTSYLVMQWEGDSEYYLHRDFDGKENWRRT